MYSPFIGTSTRHYRAVYDSLLSRQTQEIRQHLRILRRPEPSHRVPAFGRIEALRTTANIVASHDIREEAWISVDGRVEEPDGSLADGETLLDNLLRGLSVASLDLQLVLLTLLIILATMGVAMLVPPQPPSSPSLKSSHHRPTALRSGKPRPMRL